MSVGTLSEEQSAIAGRVVASQPLSWWGRALRRFMRQRASLAALCFLLVFGALAFAAPVVAPYDPGQQFRREGLDAAGRPVGPNAQFWLGTDGLGRDMLSRLLYGARVSLLVSLSASALIVLIGLLVGSAAALGGQRVDTLLMRFVDLVMSLPTLLVILLFIVVIGRSLWITIAVIVLLGWTYPARIFRAEVLALRDREFVQAARGLGLPALRVFTHHILPQLVSLIIIYFSLSVPSAIITEAILGFLGFGVPPPLPSWGEMIATGTSYYRVAPLQVIIPGLAIVLTIFCFNTVSNGLRDALDPTLR